MEKAESMSPKNWRDFLDKLVSNPVLDGLTVRFNLKKPFMWLVKNLKTVNGVPERTTTMARLPSQTLFAPRVSRSTATYRNDGTEKIFLSLPRKQVARVANAALCFSASESAYAKARGNLVFLSKATIMPSL
jgi:hypothetical protein